MSTIKITLEMTTQISDMKLLLEEEGCDSVGELKTVLKSQFKKDSDAFINSWGCASFKFKDLEITEEK